MKSFIVPEGPVTAMFADMVERGNGMGGPPSVDTWYVTEDVPYGLVLVGDLAAGAWAERGVM